MRRRASKMACAFCDRVHKGAAGKEGSDQAVTASGPEGGAGWVRRYLPAHMILFWLQPNRGIAQYDIITNIIARDLQCQQLSGGDGLSIQFVIQFFQQPGAQYAPLSVESVGGHTDALAGKQAMDDVTKSLGLRHTDFRNEAGCPHPINMSQRSQNASLGKCHELLRQAGRHRMWRNANAIRFRVKVIERRRTGAIAGKK